MQTSHAMLMKIRVHHRHNRVKTLLTNDSILHQMTRARNRNGWKDSHIVNLSLRSWPAFESTARLPLGERPVKRLIYTSPFQQGF